LGQPLARFIRRAPLVPLLFLVAGCAATRTERTSSNAFPTSVHLAHVPFFPDTTDQCGPSTLASVLTFWGHPTTPATLKSEIYLPKLKGTLPMDMVSAAESHGLKADGLNVSWDTVRAELVQGRPVLAYVDRGFSFYPIGHYVVLIGFDDARGGVFMHSGKHEDEFMRYRKFFSQWRKTDRWALMVSPPDHREVSR
jgi:ABC-type bacteriocin/lantibiotic exporter with double-glycine peptidase domain